jgi:hypothetical protein
MGARDAALLAAALPLLLSATSDPTASARREVLRSQYAFAFGREINCTALKAELLATHTTSYS